MTDLFEDKAKDWDANDRRTMLASAIGGSILEHVQLSEDMTVLDFGAGTEIQHGHIFTQLDMFEYRSSDCRGQHGSPVVSVPVFCLVFEEVSH